ncbi:MAG: pantoate--beta-alanine ligase [Prevotellaceae bacterium]|jgi:pantoate--beta-alanine ligase|nr:pantoate--beta-alanine ligase [Prevotellaceae bacterium]
MEVYTDILSLKHTLTGLKTRKTIGLVPTMGALHRGHLSLVELSNSTCDITVVSIFVNPTQFNNKDDYKHYPRTVEKDIEMLQRAGCHIVFTPTEQEIYPEKDTKVFDFGDLDKVMEGKFRPGHFNGVAQIVSRLFDIVQPDKSFFGQKDFQQTAIIKNMVRQLNLTTEIVIAPIIREQDGLAMSSRNTLLTDIQRKNAADISRALFRLKQQAASGVSVNEITQVAIRQINANPELSVEYLEIVDGKTLQPVLNWNHQGEIFACVAVNVGKIRLIDNVQLK